MPQMSPIMWMNLMLFTILIISTINSKIFSSMGPSIFTKVNGLKNTSLQIKWMW
uniref:ATP synthase F0 subunit 8 n=1 Tax=Neelus murinus TaxID=1348065 RepID=A0A6B9IQD9_9HEXA|nr:ATP synthase F0 subunit 8 [Neelus murinus]